jgi:hypothetical protein
MEIRKVGRGIADERVHLSPLELVKERRVSNTGPRAIDGSHAVHTFGQ